MHNYLNDKYYKDNISFKELSNSFNLTEDQVKLKIKKFYKYEIPTIADSSSRGWAEVGIGLFNLFTFSDYDYPDHWFLIAVTEEDENNKELYYLVEKTQGGKLVDNYSSIRNIIDQDEDTYKTDASEEGCYYLNNGGITVLELMKYIKNNTSNEYDLLYDNCQDFARQLIHRYCD